ncbi:MAG: roadblock/LC7 domain-containing protein, partial [Rubrobacteraceae bacterium]
IMRGSGRSLLADGRKNVSEQVGERESLDQVLGNLRSLSGDIDSCAVLSKDGELLASRHEEGVDRERTKAMLAALVNIAGRTARENDKENAEQVRVKTDLGHVLVVKLENGALATTTGPDARVGLVLYDMRNARGEIEKALQGEGE